MKRYAIVVEKAQANYAAYVPDLPGCVATGATIKETERRLRLAIEVHVQGLREDGITVPEPSSVVDYVEIPA
jgi:predicted RNase H-like HicB family nuclease